MTAMHPKRDINFFRALQLQEQAERQQRRPYSRLILIVAAAAVALALGGYGGSLALRSHQLSGRIQAVSAYVDDADNQARFLAGSILLRDTQRLATYNQTCADYIAQLERTGRLDRGDFDTLLGQKPEAVSVVQFTYKSPVLTISCKTADKDAPARYAEALTRLGVFEQVTYSGFSSAQNQDAYTFSIACALWPAKEAMG
ncbi:MAG: hypothetical protein ACOYJA_10485 [Christensenellales bacterium]